MKSDANEIATKLECGRSSRHNGGCGGSVGCGGCGLGGPMRYRALVAQISTLTIENDCERIKYEI